MNDYYDAFEISPVPAPGPDAVPPEPYRGIYGMPSYVTIPTTDLDASVEFWTRGLDFFELFRTPGRVVHLRRWAFQDVLLVLADEVQEAVPAMSIGFSCVLQQLDPIADACRALRPDAVRGPVDTFWNTRELEVITPENARVVFTAAKPFVPGTQEAQNLEAMGISGPAGSDGGHNEGDD